MSIVLNDRDAILQAATVRIVNPKNAWINLQPSAPGFHLNAAGQVDLGVVTVTADLVGLDDAVTFSAAGATLSNAVGRSVDVTYGGQTAIVTATVVSNGDEFKRSIVIPVLRDGAAGSTTYSWIKYADTAAGGGLSNDPAGKLYIGLAHNKPTATESTTASDYTWSLIQGPPGGQGVQGQKGSDGQSLYTWIRYSDNADGTGLYATPTASTMYIGLAVNRSSATPSSTKTDYAWSKFRGADGVGTAGARGAGHYYATGSTWSDVIAQAACPGSTPVLNDVVTISSSTYVMEKRWSGSAWVENGVVINGKLIAPDSILTSALASKSVTADKIAGEAVTAGLLAVSANPDNILPDPRFKDLVWWGMAGSVYSVGDWSDRDTAWRDSASLYLGVEAESVKQSNWFTVQKGARYRLEIQTGPSPSFAGQVSVFLLFENAIFHSIGQPNKYNWPAYGLTCQYDSSSPKQLQSFSDDYIVPPYATGRCRVVVIKKVDAGAFEFGSIRITRMSDSTLIGPGSVQTKHLAIAEGGDISSGMWGFNQGRGFWIEGAGNGHGARMALGDAVGPRMVVDPNNGVFDFIGPKIVNPQFEARTVSISSNPGDYFTHYRTASRGFCGGHTAAISNPVSPSYSWSISSSAVQAQFSLEGTTSAACVVYVSAKQAIAGDAVSCLITCAISDGGVTKTISKEVFVEFT